ncbi:MaoC family dehydratase [Cytobacillus depressus]|uniref:MaoC family dehydratase n=1 Tax=Cytobacillus depressus TaxID=1602942 RepID=A0A6L3VA60_9BACI|nr:MaoC family dehydratase N-terminal domain-containing protein [Cytobacillus depressus]KAB2336257.1 MaoC family dehydratase [Cytobacillus depressus]
MKSEEADIIFNMEEVQQFVQLLGDQNPIYQSIKTAKTNGFQSIPLPPTMPMIAYKRIKTPWQLQHPVIHRKQHCTNYHTMYINQTYHAFVKLEDQYQRKQFTFIQQSLYLYDQDRILCFKGTSQLITGGLI